MDKFTLGDFNELLAVNSRTCISLLMPSYPKGPETRQNSIRFKNLLQQAQQQIDQLSLPREAAVLLEAVKPLLEDSFFWRNQDRGLAIYLADGLAGPRIFRVPLVLPERVVVSERFHLKPLLPLIIDDVQCFVLTISQESAGLYRCSRFEIEGLEVPEMPRGLEDALRYDDPERQLQFHTKAETVKGQHIRGAVHYGTGDIADQEKERIQRYFRIVDDAVRPILHGRTEPLILMGVEFLLPLFSSANSYPHLHSKGIAHNPQEADAEEIRERCWEVMQEMQYVEMKQALEKYNNLKGTGRTAGQVETIVPAAAQGRVDRLIMVLDTAVWGRYNPESGEVTIHPHYQPGDRDMLDLAACETLNNGGPVFTASAAEMPDRLQAAAVLRY